MDETIFYIVIFVVYLIIQVIGAKKKKKKSSVSGTTTALPDAAARPASAPGAEPTMEDALREIRRALGMEAPVKPTPPPLQAAPPMPSPQPAPRLMAKPPPVRSHAPELAETAPKKSWSSEFHAYPTHYADSDFEELRGEGDRFGKSPKPQKQKKPPRPAAKTAAARKSRVEPTKPTSTGVSRAMVMKQLNSPNAAREAFVLSEILGPPRAQKRR